MSRFSDALGSILDLFLGYDFFISYAHGDGRTFPANLHRRLDAEGYRVFLDSEGFAAGDELGAVTQRRVRASSHFLLIAGPHALRSRWVARELKIALGKNRRVIVVDLDDTIGNTPVRDGIPALLGERLRISQPAAEHPANATVSAITQSFRGTRQERRRTRGALGLALVFLGVAVFAVNRWIAAAHREEQAQDAQIMKAASDALDTDPAVAALFLREVKRPREWPEWPIIASQVLVQPLPERFIPQSGFPAWYEPSLFPRFVERTPGGTWIIHRLGAPDYPVRLTSKHLYVFPASRPSSSDRVRIGIEVRESAASRLHLFDLSDPRRQFVFDSVFEDFDKAVHASDDGRWVLVYDAPQGSAGAVRPRLWHLPEGARVELSDPGAPLKLLDLSRNGAAIAGLEDGGRRIHIWTPSGGYRRVAVPRGQVATQLALSPNGRALAFETARGGIGLLRAGDAAPLLLRDSLLRASFNDVKNPPDELQVSFARSGTRVLALGGASSNVAYSGIEVWDVQDPARHVELYANAQPILRMAPDEYGPYVAAELQQGLNIWDVGVMSRGETQRPPVATYRACNDATSWFVQVFTWTPAGDRLWKLCGTNDPLHDDSAYVQVFDPRRGASLLFVDAAAAARGQIVLVPATDGLTRWDLHGGISRVTLRGPPRPPRRFVISSRGERTVALVAREDGDDVWAWDEDATAGRKVASVAPVTSIALSPEGNRIALYSPTTRRLEVRSPDAPSWVASRELGPLIVDSIRFSAGGKWLLVEAHEKENDLPSSRIEIWEVRHLAGRPIGPPQFTARVVAAGGTRDDVVYVDNANRLHLIPGNGSGEVLLAHPPAIEPTRSALAVSPDGSRVGLAVPEPGADDPESLQFALYLWVVGDSAAPRRLGSVEVVNSSPRVEFAGGQYVFLGGNDTKAWDLANPGAPPAFLDGELVGIANSRDDERSYLVVTNRTLPAMNNGERFVAMWRISGRPPRPRLLRRLPGGMGNLTLLADSWLAARADLEVSVALYPLRDEALPWMEYQLHGATHASILPLHRRRYLGP